MPTQVGTSLAKQVTDWLNAHTGAEWTVEVVSDPVTAAQTDTDAILEKMESYRSQRSWEYAVCLTDLPVLMRDRPLLADLSTQSGVALVSLPALGGLQPYRRVRQMLTQLVDEWVEASGGEEECRGRRLYSWLTDQLAPIRRESLSGQYVAVRYTASRCGGWVRLLSGMVRTNRPWRMIFGLSSALAASLAASAFGLSSSTVWKIGDRLSPLVQSVVALGSIALLVGWLISAHQLWERGKGSTSPRRLRGLYNASTILTLTLGVAYLYVGLFVANIGIALFLIPSDLLASMLSHSATWSAYLSLAWGFTTMGVIAGALGSSLQSDQAVRQAAYGYREKQRRAREAAQN
jgi:hypothetical protein